MLYLDAAHSIPALDPYVTLTICLYAQTLPNEQRRHKKYVATKTHTKKTLQTKTKKRRNRKKKLNEIQRTTAHKSLD